MYLINVPNASLMFSCLFHFYIGRYLTIIESFEGFGFKEIRALAIESGAEI